MDPEMTNLYAGLSGVSLAPEMFQLGEGVVISRTYAHFMAPFLMAFSPAIPGKPHPAPWKSAKGGLAIDITAELFLPTDVCATPLDRLNTIWWIVALLRLKRSSSIFVPVVSSERFSSIPAIQQETELWPIEIYTRRLVLDHEQSPTLDARELEWVKIHWLRAAELLSDESFSLAFQAVDSCVWNSNPSLALIAVWGALEKLFSASHQELSFRVSANIASFLEPAGRDRYRCFKYVKGLYNHRSKAAHGEQSTNATALIDTYNVARKTLLRMIEIHHVPTKAELEAGLFGDSIIPEKKDMPAQ
jgi:hypothetical protein